MRYILEHIEEVKEYMVHPQIESFRWKQVASSNDVKILQGIAGSMDRIIDITTGTELFRTAPLYL
ncbi:MAG: hypothetical protein N2645_23590 [Clostridia bacterium]|nr:hypothetical protein [Clostridia bacterium]